MKKIIVELNERFDENIATNYLMLERFYENLGGHEYKISDLGYYLNSVFVEGIGIKKEMQIYWLELLERLHLAATLSLLRHREWMQGIVAGIQMNNYILFAASLRGYLESTADCYYSLKDKPGILVDNYKNIKLAIEGNLNGDLIAQEFEESLIHFYAARKTERNPEFNPTYLNPKTNRKYLESLDGENVVLKDELYSELCEVTHPARNSTHLFVKETYNHPNSIIKITTEQGETSINNLFFKYNNVISAMWDHSVNICLICLDVLNTFDRNIVYTGALDEQYIKMRLDGLKEWQEYKQKIKEYINK